MTAIPGVDPAVPPSGTGCAECDAGGGWWFHLRRCAQCGHIGCCDSSPSQHASAHAAATGHPVIRSFEPGEAWFWSYPAEEMYEDGPQLAPPDHHPIGQQTPGPAGRVPSDWQSRLHLGRPRRRRVTLPVCRSSHVSTAAPGSLSRLSGQSLTQP